MAVSRSPRRLPVPRCLPVLAAAAVLAASLAAPHGSAQAAIGECAADAAAAEGAFYPGPSSSRVYDATFAKGPAIPHLSTHTPQGLTVWKNWDGKKRGNDLLLLGTYRKGQPSYLVGIDPDTGERKGTVRTPESHLGALGVVGTKWLVAQHGEGSKVRTYKLTDLRKAMNKAVRTGKKPKLQPFSRPQRVHGTNFMSSHDGRAWIGRYSKAAAEAKMQQYKVTGQGKLRAVGRPWQVPPQTQGVLVTDDRFVFVSGLKAGTMTVVERAGRKLDGFTGRCFATPSHGQNIVVHDGKVFVSYEGGSIRQKHKTTTRNRITHLHVADYDTLGALSNPTP